YSLGVILFELLTGHLPFDAADLAVLMQKVNSEPPSPSRYRSDLDGRLCAICLKALARKLEDRYARMSDFAEALTLSLRDEGMAVPTPETTPTVPQHEPRIVEDTLSLLRRWGWEKGLEKVRAQLASTVDDAQRTTLQFFLGWMAGERGRHEEALTRFREVEQLPALTAWALVGQAFLLHRQHNHEQVLALLEQASAQAAANDAVLRATIAHLRGTVLFHRGQL